MPLPTARLERLRGLGLAEYQARAYLALLEHGPGTARDVADASAVPRGKVHATLRDLHSRGLVDVTPERPHRWEARPVGELLALLRRRHREALERLAREEQDLVRDLAGAPHHPPPLGGITIVRGRRNVADRIRHMLNAAERDILVVTTPAGLLRLAQDEDDLAAARERGVDVRILTPDDDRSRVAARALAALADVQHAPAPDDVTLVVVDHAHALLQRAHPDDARAFRGEDLALLVDDAVLARALAELATISRAAPTSTVPPSTAASAREGSAPSATPDA